MPATLDVESPGTQAGELVQSQHLHAGERKTLALIA
jgi:hypothetical protein